MIRRLFDSDGTAGGGSSTNKFYIHDGMQIVQIFDRPSSTVNLTDRLLWTDQVDFLISDERVSSLGSAGTVYWSLPNHLGTVVDVATYNSGTDTTTIAKHRGFDSFGNITSDSASGVIIVMGYTGKLLDATTGLQNNINRWYAAPLGEWMSEDPIGFAGGDENLSRYVANQAPIAIDPSGQYKITWDPASNWTQAEKDRITAMLEKLIDRVETLFSEVVSLRQSLSKTSPCEFALLDPELHRLQYLLDVMWKQLKDDSTPLWITRSAVKSKVDGEPVLGRVRTRADNYWNRFEILELDPSNQSWSSDEAFGTLLMHEISHFAGTTDDDPSEPSKFGFYWNALLFQSLYSASSFTKSTQYRNNLGASAGIRCGTIKSILKPFDFRPPGDPPGYNDYIVK